MRGLTVCSKYDREHDFDVMILTSCSNKLYLFANLRWICHKHSTDVEQQAKEPCKWTIFVAQLNFHVSPELTLHRYWKTLRYCKRRNFSSIIPVLRQAATFLHFCIYLVYYKTDTAKDAILVPLLQYCDRLRHFCIAEFVWFIIKQILQKTQF